MGTGLEGNLKKKIYLESTYKWIWWQNVFHLHRCNFFMLIADIFFISQWFVFMFFSSNSNPDYFIIREIYENDNASEYFESELERALEEKVETIIIEPSRLGDDTAQWIIVGNCLHKTAVISGLGCLCLGLGLPERGLAYFPLGSVSLFCAAIHTVSWQFDPCCKYQVEYDSRQLQRLPLHNLTSSSPVVLVRKNDRRRRILQSVVALSAVGLCSWRFYNWYLRWSFIGAVGHEPNGHWIGRNHII